MTPREPSEAAIAKATTAVRNEIGSQLCDWHRGKPRCPNGGCECRITALAALRAAYAVDATEGREG